MVRLMGAVLVAAGCAWVGFQVSEGMRRRVAELRELARGLALVERELELWAPPLPQLMERAAAHSRGAAQRLFRACYQGLDRLDREDFPTLWRRLVEEERSWRGEERELLVPLGELLGRYDGPAQRDGVAAVRARLEELADRAQADCRRQGRVYRALGLSGGAFLVILLL